ncbi:SAM-dependent methyltransferase [Tessaracoccus aquimaris]|uniref:SAM-dependent methyltransferase n=1 Tax=Tessaracoccus aquimaris TaxID=1332264 RepID=A0A1Q2CP40_9ACTN|nr:class I SAM-dependent methyltransferase [Tessaracoccus aquimaris]AQP47888.1 SAM-dependent methyltransferase [Tessaracoccus aquimaris]
MPDQIFDHPRLAAVYDPLDPDRGDLDAYVAMVAEFGATDVLDIGCGTGTLATRLAADGVTVVGVDPAFASLEVARRKPYADRVRFVHGVARDVLPLQVDLAFMTANVAQVFLTDEQWADTLAAAREALRPGGRLVFESRVPERRAWEGWTKEATRQVVDVAHEGPVEDWAEVTSVDGELVTFESPTIFHRDGVRVDSTSTLRFRSRDALESSLRSAGFVVEEVRDAPDRPGAEYVFVASVGSAD